MVAASGRHFLLSPRPLSTPLLCFSGFILPPSCQLTLQCDSTPSSPPPPRPLSPLCASFTASLSFSLALSLSLPLSVFQSLFVLVSLPPPLFSLPFPHLVFPSRSICLLCGEVARYEERQLQNSCLYSVLIVSSPMCRGAPVYQRLF